MRMLATMLVLLGLAAAPARGAEKQCMYGQEFFSVGDVSCQGGAQFRCVAGSWQATGLDCADSAADGGESEMRVDPSRKAPAVREPAVKQPAAPAVPQD